MDKTVQDAYLRLTADEVLPAYSEHFGIELDREPPSPQRECR